MIRYNVCSLSVCLAWAYDGLGREQATGADGQVGGGGDVLHLRGHHLEQLLLLARRTRVALGDRRASRQRRADVGGRRRQILLQHRGRPRRRDGVGSHRRVDGVGHVLAHCVRSLRLVEGVILGEVLHKLRFISMSLSVCVSLSLRLQLFV